MPEVIELPHRAHHCHYSLTDGKITIPSLTSHLIMSLANRWLNEAKGSITSKPWFHLRKNCSYTIKNRSGRMRNRYAFPKNFHLVGKFLWKHAGMTTSHQHGILFIIAIWRAIIWMNCEANQAVRKHPAPQQYSMTAAWKNTRHLPIRIQWPLSWFHQVGAPDEISRLAWGEVATNCELIQSLVGRQSTF